jgi:hypothetical protein
MRYPQGQQKGNPQDRSVMTEKVALIPVGKITGTHE